MPHNSSHSRHFVKSKQELPKTNQATKVNRYSVLSPSHANITCPIPDRSIRAFVLEWTAAKSRTTKHGNNEGGGFGVNLGVMIQN